MAFPSRPGSAFQQPQLRRVPSGVAPQRTASGCPPLAARRWMTPGWGRELWTKGVARKPGGHAATVALYFIYSNFARVHPTLRVTPATEAGVTNHTWSIDAIVGLLAR